MDAVQKTGIYWKLKEEAPDRTLWRTALEVAVDLEDIIIIIIIIIIIMYIVWSNREEIDGRGRQQVWEREDARARVLYIYRVVVEKPRETDKLEDPSVDGRIILRWIFRKWDVGAWAGLIWLRIGTGGGYW